MLFYFVFYFVIVVFVGVYILKKIVIGRYVYVVGSNEVVVYFFGIKV